MKTSRIHFLAAALTIQRPNRKLGRARMEVRIHCPVIGSASDAIIENYRASIRSIGRDPETYNPVWAFRSLCDTRLEKIRCPWCLPRALAVLVRAIGVNEFGDAAVEARAIVEAERIESLAEDIENDKQYVMPGVL